MIIRYLHIITLLVTISSFMLFSSPLLFAQKAKMQSAVNYFNYGEINKAKEAIDLAAANEKSAGLAKTWYYRGLIYQSIHESKDEQISSIAVGALTHAYEAYKKTMELDEKKEFEEDIVKRLEVCAIHFINKGVKDYTGKNYEEALDANEKAISISKLLNKPDTLALYNAALSSERLNKTDKAIGFYRELINFNWGGPRIYSFLINQLKKNENSDDAFEVIKKGRERFPDDKNLIIEELNYFLLTEQFEEAIKNIKTAIEKDADNNNLYYVLGTVYDQLQDFEGAKGAYQKALDIATARYSSKNESYKNSIGTEKENIEKQELQELKTEYFNILYNYGVLYYNEGVKGIKQISSIKDNIKYSNEKQTAEETMLKALPFLEKALELDPRDKNTLISLKSLYARVNNDAKFQEMKDRLEN